MPEPEEEFPVFEFDEEALKKQMEKIGILPQVELPESPGSDDLDACWTKATEEADGDNIKIQERARSLISGLGHADVELLGRDLFRISASEINLARQSADAVMRAREYLELAISDGPNTEQRTREYAKAVTQAYAAKSAVDTTAYESGAKSFRADATTVRARLEELGGQEAILGLLTMMAENTSDTLGAMRDLRALDAAISEAANGMWPRVASDLLALERRRHWRSGWLKRMYAAILLGYALILIAVGVGADALLAHTPEAGIVLSLCAAIGLYAVDRLFISKRLERWDKCKNVQLLKREITACADTLAKIRSNQVGIDAMAGASGVPKQQLLDSRLLA